jgi:hypothetical protein
VGVTPSSVQRWLETAHLPLGDQVRATSSLATGAPRLALRREGWGSTSATPRCILRRCAPTTSCIATYRACWMRALRRIGPRGRCSCAAWSRVAETQALVVLFPPRQRNAADPTSKCVCLPTVARQRSVCAGFRLRGEPRRRRGHPRWWRERSGQEVRRQESGPATLDSGTNVVTGKCASCGTQRAGRCVYVECAWCTRQVELTSWSLVQGRLIYRLLR